MGWLVCINLDMAQWYLCVCIQYQSVLIDDRMSWTIYDALPHAQYEVQLQAKDEFDGIWSDWTDTVYAVSWTGNKIHGNFLYCKNLF